MHTEQVWNNWSLRQQSYLNNPTFTEYFVITLLFSAHVLLWGALFVGAPVRPNMLNMPKSASADKSLQCSECRVAFSRPVDLKQHYLHTHQLVEFVTQP